MKKFILLTSLCGGLLFAGTRSVSALRLKVGYGSSNLRYISAVGGGEANNIILTRIKTAAGARNWLRLKTTLLATQEVMFYRNGRLVINETEEFAEDVELNVLVFDEGDSTLRQAKSERARLLASVVPVSPPVTKTKIVIQSFDDPNILFEIELAPEATTTEIKELAAEQFGYDDVREFDLFFRDSVCDDEMTVTDLDDDDDSCGCVSFCVKSKNDVPAVSKPVSRPESTQVPAPSEEGEGDSFLPASPVVQQPAAQPGVTYQVTILVGVIPRIFRVTLDTDATVADLEIAARQQKNIALGGLDLEVVLGDHMDNEYQTLSKNQRLNTLNFDGLDLGIRLQGVASSDADHEVPEEELLTFSYDDALLLSPASATQAQVPPPGAAPVGTPYRFTVPTRGIEELTLYFAAGATVLDAKKIIAEHFGSSTAATDVTLLFSSKALRDGFVLDRLRIGNGIITVYPKETAEVLIVTAKAMRKD